MKLNKLSKQLQKPAIWSIGVNGISVCIGTIILLSLSIFFESYELGLYFTFTGLGTLVFFAEFGLGQTIIQIYKHYCDDPREREQLIYSIKLWFRISLLFLLGILFLMPYFVEFEKAEDTHYRNAWMIFSLFIAWNYYLSKDFYLMQGADKMLQYWRYRFFEFGVYSLLLLVLIFLGHGIYSLVIATAVSTIINFLYLSKFVKFQRITMPISPMTAFNFWRSNIAGIQFKVGVTWLGNNSINRLIIPIVFITQSSALAGQYGMSLSLVSIAYSVSVILINIKLPAMSSFIVNQDLYRFKKIFHRGLKQAIIMFLVVILMEAVVVASLLEFSVLDRIRLLNVTSIFIIFLIYLLLMFINSFSCYMRSFKEDNIAKYSVVANSLILFLGYIILNNSNLSIFLYSYLLIVFVQFLFSVNAFLAFRKVKKL